MELVQTLPEEKRTALLLFEIEGFAVAEIAEITGEPRGTVLARLSRTRAELQRAVRVVRRERTANRQSTEVKSMSSQPKDGAKEEELRPLRSLLGSRMRRSLHRMNDSSRKRFIWFLRIPILIPETAGFDKLEGAAQRLARRRRWRYHLWKRGGTWEVFVCLRLRRQSLW